MENIVVVQYNEGNVEMTFVRYISSCIVKS